MRVLVTGTAGFIGFHVASYLLRRGDTVVGADIVSKLTGNASAAEPAAVSRGWPAEFNRAKDVLLGV